LRVFERISRSEIRELSKRRFSREAHDCRDAGGRVTQGAVTEGTRVAGKPPGRLSFGYFSLAEQRKVPRRRAREPASNTDRACKALLLQKEKQKPVADEIRSYREEQEESANP